MHDDVRATARAARERLFADPRWPRAGGWPDLGDDAVDAAIVGVGTHATSLSGSGAHATPLAVREAIARYAMHTIDGGPMASLRIADAGDADAPDADEAGATALVARAAERARLVVVLGGDNAATVPALLGGCGRPERAGLITIDAHHDVRDGVTNGSPVERLIGMGLPGARVVQVGIQDFANSDAYAERAAGHGITVIGRDACEGSMVELAARAVAVAGEGGGPIHVDVDVDVCDRSVAPGCPASMPGGLSAWQLRSLVRALVAHPQVASIDFTEVDATADVPDGRTVRLVALCVLEALAALAAR